MQFVKAIANIERIATTESGSFSEANRITVITAMIIAIVLVLITAPPLFIK